MIVTPNRSRLHPHVSLSIILQSVTLHSIPFITSRIEKKGEGDVTHKDGAAHDGVHFITGGHDGDEFVRGDVLEVNQFRNAAGQVQQGVMHTSPVNGLVAPVQPAQHTTRTTSIEP